MTKTMQNGYKNKNKLTLIAQAKSSPTQCNQLLSLCDFSRIFWTQFLSERQQFTLFHKANRQGLEALSLLR